MSNISKKAKAEKQLKPFDNHQNFLSRITKTLYYGKLPNSDRLSLPVTELATELFSEAKIGKSLERLHCNDAASISRNACISPCSFILAMLYLERLKACNSDYLAHVNPSELFLVSLMVSSKFLFDDGEEDEVFTKEWAISGGLSIKQLVQLEKEFLNAIKWEIFVNETTFWKKLNDLEKMLSKREGLSRGWFTYTELTSILTIVDASHLSQYIASLVIVLLATYTVGILTVVSSMFIVSEIPGSCLQPAVNKIQVNDMPAYIKCNLCQDNAETISKLNLENLTEFKCDLYEEIPCAKKQIDAADVLTTSLILASIKPVSNKISENKSYIEYDELDDNKELISWDWWSSPTMNWLASTSELAHNFNLMPNFKDYVYLSYLDSTVLTSKIIKQEDHVHKATRTRIQDQLERSWHKEWTDTIKYYLLINEKPFELFKTLKT